MAKQETKKDREERERLEEIERFEKGVCDEYIAALAAQMPHFLTPELILEITVLIGTHGIVTHFEEYEDFSTGANVSKTDKGLTPIEVLWSCYIFDVNCFEPPNYEKMTVEPHRLERTARWFFYTYEFYSEERQLERIRKQRLFYELET